MVQAYRVACHLGDEEEDLDATMRITNSTVFNKILIFMIKEASPSFPPTPSPNTSRSPFPNSVPFM